MLYTFITKLKKAAISYKNDIAVLTVFNNYAEFLKNVKKGMNKKLGKDNGSSTK